ncbi:MAG: hypothetical protein ACLVL2_18815 [Bacteroides cellulosilyticus]
MDPKNIDRAGKGFLVVAGAAIVAIGKKYGPTIIKGAGKILGKLYLKDNNSSCTLLLIQSSKLIHLETILK